MSFDFQKIANKGKDPNSTVTDIFGTPIKGVQDPTVLRDSDLDNFDTNYDFEVRLLKLYADNKDGLNEYAKIYKEQADGKLEVFYETINFVDRPGEEPYYLVFIRFAYISLVPPKKIKG